MKDFYGDLNNRVSSIILNGIQIVLFLEQCVHISGWGIQGSGELLKEDL
jgi:hypothetical protein